MARVSVCDLVHKYGQMEAYLCNDISAIIQQTMQFLLSLKESILENLLNIGCRGGRQVVFSGDKACDREAHREKWTNQAKPD